MGKRILLTTKSDSWALSEGLRGVRLVNGDGYRQRQLEVVSGGGEGHHGEGLIHET